jgi:hypothetical protein
VIVSAYVASRHRVVAVPDPTVQLAGMMRAFVESRGARFVVGMQTREPALEAISRRPRSHSQRSTTRSPTPMKSALDAGRARRVAAQLKALLHETRVASETDAAAQRRLPP